MSKKQKINNNSIRTRLPTVVFPRHYDLSIHLDTENWRYEGSLTLTLAVGADKSSSELCVHARKSRVNITSVTLRDGTVADSIDEADSEDMVRIGFSKPLATGAESFDSFPAVGDAPGSSVQLDNAKKNNEKWTQIHFKFTGPINQNDMDGLYKYSYKSEGKSLDGIMTFFEPVGARCLFPCFDEPGMKAHFSVTLRHPTRWTALNNMDPISSCAISDTVTETKFAPTPLMSTYLLCIVAAELVFVERVAKSGVRIRSYAPLGYDKQMLVMPTDIAVIALDFYEQHFQVPFPLKKLDQFASPQFAMGAEEQWGLITYTDQCLLVNEQSSLTVRRKVFEIVSHEIAHMWFGNLVTLTWWDELWLKEALATVLSFIVMDKCRNELGAWEYFIPRSEAGLDVDRVLSTRTVDIAINTVKDIGESFDAITYYKGGTLMRMLLDYAGEKGVQEGLSLYLKRHGYGCTVGGDMYAALSEATGQNIKELMYSWISEPGFPLIEVLNWPPDQDGKVHLRQSRFVWTADDKAAADAVSGTVWTVPVRVRRGDTAPGSDEMFLLSRAEDSISKCASDVLLLNAGRPGFFRCRYPESLLSLLGQAIREAGSESPIIKTSPRDRYGLIGDVIALTLAGQYSPATLLEFALNFGSETSPDALTAAGVALGHVKRCCALADPSGKKAASINAKIVAAWEKSASELGLQAQPGESDEKQQLRAVTLSIIGRSSHKPTLVAVQKLFASDPMGKSLDTNTRYVFWHLVGLYGDASVHASLRKMRQDCSDAQTGIELTTALGATRDPKMLKANLDWATAEGSPIRRQDARCLTSRLGSSQSRAVAWEWFKENYDDGWLAPLSQNHRMNTLKAGFAHAVELIDEIEAFFTEKRRADFRKTFAQFLETLKAYKRFLEKSIEGTKKIE